MDLLYKKVLTLLSKNKKTISVMESCTGGGISNTITNIEGSSNVFKFGAVTYSNEYKIKMGVSSEIIRLYSVYSSQVANEMSYKIAEFCNADYGIGVTGKLMSADKNNTACDDNLVYISLYDKKKKMFYERQVRVCSSFREENKRKVIQQVFLLLDELI